MSKVVYGKEVNAEEMIVKIVEAIETLKDEFLDLEEDTEVLRDEGDASDWYNRMCYLDSLLKCFIASIEKILGIPSVTMDDVP